MSKKVNFNFRNADGSFIPSKTLSYSDYLALSYGLLAENGTVINVGGVWEVAHYLEPMSPSEYADYLERISLIDSQTQSDLCDNRGSVDFSNFFPACAIKGRKKYEAPRMHVYVANLDTLAKVPRAFERLAYMQTLDIEVLDCWREAVKSVMPAPFATMRIPNSYVYLIPWFTYYLLTLVINSKYDL